jgi:hypothetical protein
MAGEQLLIATLLVGLGQASCLKAAILPRSLITYSSKIKDENLETIIADLW